MMMTQREQLEWNADRIEAVLAVHKLPARVTGGTVTPRWVRFQILPAVGAKISTIKGLHEELAAALDVPTCRVSRRGAAVAIEVPRDDPQPVRLLPLYQQLSETATDQQSPVPPVTAILGLAEDGAPLLIRLPSKDVGHVLIAGAEGAGKTTLLHSIIFSLALAGDSDEIAFCFLGDIAPALSEAIRKRGFQVTTDSKLSTIVLGGIRAAGRHVIFVADDVTGQATVASTLARIMGREKVHLILAWDGVPPERIVNLFKVRLVGQVGSVEDARTASGWRGTGAERLTGQGDFLAVAEGRISRFRAAHVTIDEIRQFPTPSRR